MYIDIATHGLKHWATDGKFFEYLEASKSSKRSYTQFTLTLFIRGFFLRQNQSSLSYTVIVLVASLRSLQSNMLLL